MDAIPRADGQQQFPASGPDTETDRKKSRLPLRAEALKKILVRYLGRNRWCWPRQKLLAAELGISCRQVQSLLALLADTDEIEIERTNRSNRYYIPPRPNTKKTSHSDAKKTSHPNTAPLGELNSKEEGRIEAAPPTAETENKTQQEHPRIEAWLKERDAYDALPEDEREKIEAVLREDWPVANTQQEFRMACIAVMQENPFFLRFARFKRTFVKIAPGMPNDRNKWGFFGYLEKRLSKLNPTLEEMLDALERLIEDPRRGKDNRDPRNFAREAHRFLPGYIQNERAWKKQQARGATFNREKKDMGSASAATQCPAPPGKPKPPISFEAFGDCADIAAAICAKIGESRWNLWFAGRTHFAREGDLLRVGCGPQARDFLRENLRTEILEALSAIRSNLNYVEFVATR